MEKALHGLDIVNLKTFLEREGTDKRNWKIKPTCPECGEEVHPFNIKSALAGFQEAKPEILARGRQKPGFDHYDNPFDDCPNSLRNDPRFHGLKDVEIDVRTRERNRKILMTPEVRKMNRSILTTLMRELTGQREIAEQDRDRIWRTGERWLLGMSALGEYPWLMPYALALLQHKAEFKKGAGQLSYRGNGEQMLPYTRFDGRSGLVRIPQTIQLNWVNTGKRRTYYTHFKRGGTTEVIFEVSQEAAQRLACVTSPTYKYDQPIHR